MISSLCAISVRKCGTFVDLICCLNKAFIFIFFAFLGLVLCINN
jgi:hypothetical protein